ncbi:MAG: hypothetical protein IKB86_07910 [Clostridia bacterium]|nr:hypothetical protein [Clostridia bacterium]
MSKVSKNKKVNSSKKGSKAGKKRLPLFPVLFFTVPFVLFLLFSLTRYAYTDKFNYGNNFIYFFEAIKNYKEFLFPSVIFLTVGLGIVLLNKLFAKKTSAIIWIILSCLGITIILLGSRILFITVNQISLIENFSFIFNGITEYTFLFSLEITLLIESILEYFDKFLNK